MSKVKQVRPARKNTFPTTFKLPEMEYMLKELEYGMDVAANTLYLAGEVSSETLYEIVAKIEFLIKCNGTERSITLNVSSFGGDVYAMFGIHDYIRSCVVPVNTVCIGSAMSAGGFLLASGTGARRMTANSTVMLHQFNSAIQGSTTAVNKNVQHTMVIQDRAEELLALYTKKPKAFWKQETRDDMFLTATQCLELGVVDEIIKAR